MAATQHAAWVTQHFAAKLGTDSAACVANSGVELGLCETVLELLQLHSALRNVKAPSIPAPLTVSQPGYKPTLQPQDALAVGEAALAAASADRFPTWQSTPRGILMPPARCAPADVDLLCVDGRHGEGRMPPPCCCALHIRS